MTTARSRRREWSPASSLTEIAAEDNKTLGVLYLTAFQGNGETGILGLTEVIRETLRAKELL